MSVRDVKTSVTGSWNSHKSGHSITRLTLQRCLDMSKKVSILLLSVWQLLVWASPNYKTRISRVSSTFWVQFTSSLTTHKRIQCGSEIWPFKIQTFWWTDFKWSSSVMVGISLTNTALCLQCLPNIGKAGSRLEVRRQGEYQSFVTLVESKPKWKIEDYQSTPLPPSHHGWVEYRVISQVFLRSNFATDRQILWLHIRVCVDFFFKLNLLPPYSLRSQGD